jgi:hypothetical protein
MSEHDLQDATRSERNPLLEEAQAHLSLLAQGFIDAELSEKAIALGLQCHGQMLDLGEDRKEESVPFAITGANLLRAARELDAPLPSWVEVHEEQCCRYGGLWIHSLARAEHTTKPEWLESGITLLERLIQINPEARPWVPSLQDDLRAILSQRDREHRQPSIAALVNYFDDEDMLRWQWEEGFLDRYDRVYIWDGPYQLSSHSLLNKNSGTRLDTTDLGRRILADPRVVYKHETWKGEAQKRIDAYSAVQEDIIALHDSDEFSVIKPEELTAFWQSDQGVACHLIENIYSGGYSSCSSDYSGANLDELPRRWGIFKRNIIPANRHIDYLWLVGVEQKPLSQQQLFPLPLCHTYHLTGCRSSTGQRAKIQFYQSLALKDTTEHPVLNKLEALVASKKLTQDEAQLIFLRGDLGFSGVPHLDSGLRLKQPLANANVSQALFQKILSDAHQGVCRQMTVLNDYPSWIWIPEANKYRNLTCVVENQSHLQATCWTWRENEQAEQSLRVSEEGNMLAIELPKGNDQIGVLLQLIASTTDGQRLLQDMDLNWQPCADEASAGRMTTGIGATQPKA